MRDASELLMRIIANETKCIEAMRQTLKEDELTILRLKNKARMLTVEIKERTRLVEEYRVYLKDISEATKARVKLVSSTKSRAYIDSSDTKIKFIKNLEKEN